MKNILYIGKYNGIIGGIERYMQKSADLLRRHGYTVHYRYIEPGGKDPEVFAAAFDSVKLFAPADEISKSVDLVMLHNIIDVKYLEYLPQNKTVFFAHDHNIYCQRHHYYTPVGRINCHRSYNKFICQVCALGRNQAPPLTEYRKFPAVVLSDFMAGNLRKNGFNRVFKLPAFIQTVPTEYRFMPDGVLRILFLGQLIRGKGADLMFNALAHLDMPFSCTVAGAGKDRAMLETLVEKFKLRDKVTFTGFVSETETLWKNCDVFCFPIRWQEPFGLVGLEAMAHGIPSVAFDRGGVREWLCDGENGLAVSDIAQMTEALHRISSQCDTLLPEMRKNCFRIATEKFSEAKFVDMFNHLAEGLL